MKKFKRYLLYGLTIGVIIFSLVWEYYIMQWEEVQPSGGVSPLRVDLFVLYPLVGTLVALSLYQLFKKDKS